MDFGSEVLNWEGRPQTDVSQKAVVVLDADGVGVPKAPTTVEETGIHAEILADLAMKIASLVPHFTTDWLVQRLCLPLSVVVEILDQWAIGVDQDLLTLAVGQTLYRAPVVAIGNGACQFSYSDFKLGADDGVDLWVLRQQLLVEER